MQKAIKFRQCVMLLIFILCAEFCSAATVLSTDGGSPIQIKEGNVQSIPKGNTIQATLDGHWLTVTFTQDIGTLTMELEKVSGPVIFNYPWVVTPDSYQFFLNQTGDYIITFTLSNGDEYYGEFTVTD